MSEKYPNESEYKILHLTAQHVNRFGIVPKAKDFTSQYYVGKSTISNARKSLKKKGYLDKHNRPTHLGIELINQCNDIVPLHVPFLGNVKAGKTRTNDIRVDTRDVRELGDPDIPTVTIPNSSNGAKVIVQQVVGESMEDERIYPGDYVFVEVFEKGEMPNQGELVVTRYILYRSTTTLEETSIFDDDWDGPTIKYYYDKGDHYRLSTRKNTEQSEYTIRASFVKPVGKVIGIYRPIGV